MPPAPSWASTRKRPIWSPGEGNAAFTCKFYPTRSPLSRLLAVPGLCLDRSNAHSTYFPDHGGSVTETARTTPMPPAITAWPGQAYPLGATFDGSGTHLRRVSEVAGPVQLVPFDRPGSEAHQTPVQPTGVDAHIWHCYLP